MFVVSSVREPSLLEALRRVTREPEDGESAASTFVI